MNDERSTPDSGDAPPTASSGRRGPPWTVIAIAALCSIEAIVVADHARRLLAGIALSEETLGLAALGPLDREVPAAVIEGFVALGLLVAAVAVVRRSRLALVYVGIVQIAVIVEVIARTIGTLSALPTAGLTLLAVAIGGLSGARPTRRWCDEPILLRR